MVYRNKITGITFESDCVCTGGQWEHVTPAPTEPVKAEEKKEDTPKKVTRGKKK